MQSLRDDGVPEGLWCTCTWPVKIPLHRFLKWGSFIVFSVTQKSKQKASEARTKSSSVSFYVSLTMELASERQCKRSSAASTWSSVVDGESMRPGQWLGFVLYVAFSALTLMVVWQE